MTVSLLLLKLHKSSSYVCLLMTLKQIFQLESIHCVYLNDILKRLLAKVCFDASFMGLFRFVDIQVTSNSLCC